MRITFIKGSGKYDRMLVDRDGTVESIDCPKQRIVPHDMVHYAVESTLHKRGFLTRLRDGEAASFYMAATPESDGVERLVEVFQGDAWSGGTSDPQDMLDLYLVTCNARACAPLAVTCADIVAIRLRIEELDRSWRAVAVGESLGFDL